MKDSINESSELTKMKFGWWRRGHCWGDRDHLIILGFNKGRRHFFAFDRSKVYKKTDLMTTKIKGPHNPLVLAKRLFRQFDSVNYMGAVFDYEGTLFVKHGSTHRHFVSVAVEGVEDDMKEQLGYKVLDYQSGLSGQISYHHIPVVQQLIEAKLVA